MSRVTAHHVIPDQPERPEWPAASVIGRVDKHKYVHVARSSLGAWARQLRERRPAIAA